MSALSLDNLPELVDAYEIPTEISVDPYMPSSDDYSLRDRRIRNMLAAEQATLKAAQTQAARLKAIDGLSNVEIAKRVGVTPGTVGNWLKQPAMRRYASLLYTYNIHQSAGTTAHRKNILYRIAIDNEKERPNVAITAIQELNKIDGVYADNDKQSGKVEIVINNQLLPQTSLDRVPDNVIDAEIDG